MSISRPLESAILIGVVGSLVDLMRLMGRQAPIIRSRIYGTDLAKVAYLQRHRVSSHETQTILRSIRHTSVASSLDNQRQVFPRKIEINVV